MFAVRGSSQCADVLGMEDTKGWLHFLDGKRGCLKMQGWKDVLELLNNCFLENLVNTFVYIMTKLEYIMTKLEFILTK